MLRSNCRAEGRLLCQDFGEEIASAKLWCGKKPGEGARLEEQSREMAERAGRDVRRSLTARRKT